jgi:hypothetical protein
MKKIYLSLVAVAMSLSLMAQTVVIGTSTTAPSGSTYRSPWSPLYGYSYVQTIYLQSEINTAGAITSLNYFYSGESLENSNEVTVWMGTVEREAFATTTDWEPVANLTQVFQGAVSYTTLPGIVTVNLTTPFNYNNTGNLVIAIDENVDGYSEGTSFFASEVGTTRTIYFNDDDAENNPDPAAPPTADGIRTKVGNIEINFGTPTPVKIGSFTGKTNGAANLLSWNTLTEQNNSGFDVQRSLDGSNFSSIGFVGTKASSGNSNANIAYTFSDAKPAAGSNYYRLLQKDKDGHSSLSDIVLLKGAGSGARLSVAYPNPVKASLSVIVSATGTDKATVQIVDLSGKIVSQQVSAIATGDNIVKINTANLPKGMYTIKAILKNGKQALNSKFIKE